MKEKYCLIITGSNKVTVLHIEESATYEQMEEIARDIYGVGYDDSTRRANILRVSESSMSTSGDVFGIIGKCEISLKLD